jgi:hypothetical protein
MTRETDDPAFWLRRAKEVREIAEQLSDQEMRDILEEIARGYQRVAHQVRCGSHEPEVN